jgi:hypothetical protein
MQRLIWTVPAGCDTPPCMTDDPVPSPAKQPKSQRAQHREGRLKVALKANMAKRKQQVRARTEDDATGQGGDKTEKG